MFRKDSLKVTVAKCSRAPQQTWLVPINDGNFQQALNEMRADSLPSTLVEVSYSVPLSHAAALTQTTVGGSQRSPQSEVLRFVELLKPLVDFEKLA